MADLSTKPTRRYPSLPDPGDNIEAHSEFLRAIRAAVQTHERRDRDVLNSFVRLGELVELGLAVVHGSQIVPVEAEAAAAPAGDTGYLTLTRGATWARATGAIATPVNTVDLYIAEAAEIEQVVVFGEGGPGSCQIDIWKDTYANFPPTDADSITGGNEPAISAGDKYSDSVLSGWTTSLAVGDVLRFNLDSASTFTRISVFLVMRKL